MGLRTRLTEQYGLEVPIVSAGMAFVSRAPLVAAVSRAGGLGTLGASAMTPELLLSEVAEIRAATDRPFAVNVIPRFGSDALIAAIGQARVPVATFFWDDPPEHWIGTLAAADTRVWIQVGSPDEARRAVAQGADALVVQGAEAGGHNRSVASTMTLLPTVLDAVDVPVIAAGGIADGRGLAAALVLGAAGALLGTRFLMSEEADANAGHQERIAAASVADTARHNIFGIDFPDATVRGLRNAIVAEYQGRDQPPPYTSVDPASLPVIGTTSAFGQDIPLQRFNGLPPVRATQGDLDQMSLLAGETVGLIDDVQAAGALVRAIADQAASLVGSRFLDAS